MPARRRHDHDERDRCARARDARRRRGVDDPLRQARAAAGDLDRSGRCARRRAGDRAAPLRRQPRAVPRRLAARRRQHRRWARRDRGRAEAGGVAPPAARDDAQRRGDGRVRGDVRLGAAPRHSRHRRSARRRSGDAARPALGRARPSGDRARPPATSPAPSAMRPGPSGSRSARSNQIRCVRDRLPTVGTVPLTSWMPFLAPLAATRRRRLDRDDGSLARALGAVERLVCPLEERDRVVVGAQLGDAGREVHAARLCDRTVPRSSAPAACRADRRPSNDDSGRITANSSPPTRHATSAERTTSRTRSAASARTPSPARWPMRSLIALKSSRSKTTSARLRL